jgi:hypothetical protein
VISGIKIEFTRASVGARGGPMRVYRRTGGAILQVLAGQIKKRVTRRGDLAGQPVQAYPSGSPRIVNAAYPISGGSEEVGGRVVRRGAGVKVFKSSRDLHRTTRLGSFNVTGGMWSGMSVVVGKTSAIRFRGRSAGQEVKLLKFRGSDSRFRFERREDDAVFFEARVSRAKVSNALKAATVFSSKDVSLLAISQRELASLTGGLIAGTARAIIAIGPAAVQWQGAVTDEMTREVFRRLL